MRRKNKAWKSDKLKKARQSHRLATKTHGQTGPLVFLRVGKCFRCRFQRDRPFLSSPFLPSWDCQSIYKNSFMDSTNMVDLHHQPEELFFLNASTSLDSEPDLLLNGFGFIPSNGRTLSNSRYEHHLIDPPSLTCSHHTVHDLGFQWSNHYHQSAQQALQAKIKEEYSGLDSLSLGMVIPSLNIQSTYFPSMEPSFCMNSEALDILNSSMFFDNMSYGLPQQLHTAAQGAFINMQEIPASVNGGTEGKRACCSSLDSPKPSKKPRPDSGHSLPPFKVRKEKLGDRIAALQQLVAPFGKTDTASVLMEAIGYIKFLQEQVETLSVPYMRSSSTKKLRAAEEVSTANDREDSKPDLRSRGLCLVPLSCTSYVTNDML